MNLSSACARWCRTFRTTSGCCGPQLASAIDAIQRASLRFDALVKPRHLPVLFQFLQRYPDLPVVIDHGAKPAIASGEIDAWRDQMKRIARCTDAYCKLSGLVTEAGPQWTTRAAALRRRTDRRVRSEATDVGQRLAGVARCYGRFSASPYASWYDSRDLTSIVIRRTRIDLRRTASVFYGVA